MLIGCPKRNQASDDFMFNSRGIMAFADHSYAKYFRDAGRSIEWTGFDLAKAVQRLPRTRRSAATRRRLRFTDSVTDAHRYSGSCFRKNTPALENETRVLTPSAPKRLRSVGAPTR